MFKNLFQGAIVALTLVSATSVSAFGELGPSNASFNVSIAGIRAGRLDLSAKVTDRQYGVAMNLRSTGLLAAVAKYSFVANVTGHTTGTNAFVPAKYSETSDTGSDTKDITMRYLGGVPQPSKTFPVPALSGKAQKGTIDPLTAIFAVFRDRSAQEFCQTKLDIYDGKRRTQLVLTKGKTDGGTATCSGAFNRVDGFSAQKLAQGTSFPLTVTYSKSGDTYVVKKVEVSSARGRATFSRR